MVTEKRPTGKRLRCQVPDNNTFLSSLNDVPEDSDVVATKAYSKNTGTNQQLMGEMTIDDIPAMLAKSQDMQAKIRASLNSPIYSRTEHPSIQANSRTTRAKSHILASRKKSPTNVMIEQPAVAINSRNNLEKAQVHRERINRRSCIADDATVDVDDVIVQASSMDTCVDSQVLCAGKNQNISNNVTDDDVDINHVDTGDTRVNRRVSRASAGKNRNSSPSVTIDSDHAATGNKGNSINIRANSQLLGARSNRIGSSNTITEPARSNKRTRGPTCVPKTWGQNFKDNVSFNGLGQPNDLTMTSKLASFLGAIARNGNYCPLHIKDWRLVPEKKKEDMLREVKLRFDLPPGSDHFILHSINLKWKNWKCTVKSSSFDPTKTSQEQLVQISERVNAEQYEKLLDHWSTEEAKRISEKNKESRAKLEILHRMGKRSYAVVNEIMKDHMGRYPTRAELFEKCCSPPDGSPMCQAVQEAIEKMKQLANIHEEDLHDNDIVHDPDDEFAKVMGRDKDGRLRMYGMGVKSNDIYGGKPTRAALERKCMEDNEELRIMKQKLEELTALVHDSRSSGKLDGERTSFSPSNNQVSSRQVNHPPRVKVGSRVELKSLANINETVAIGNVRAVGGVIFHGRDLGPGICEVVVQTRVKDEEMLIYPYEHIETIGEAIGAPIAWPISLVVLADDY